MKLLRVLSMHLLRTIIRAITLIRRVPLLILLAVVLLLFLFMNLYTRMPFSQVPLFSLI